MINTHLDDLAGPAHHAPRIAGIRNEYLLLYLINVDHIRGATHHVDQWTLFLLVRVLGILRPLTLVVLLELSFLLVCRISAGSRCFLLQES